jgi:hypothetical protein
MRKALEILNFIDHCIGVATRSRGRLVAATCLEREFCYTTTAARWRSLSPVSLSTETKGIE